MREEENMDKNIVSINLNPLEDGITVKNYEAESTSGRFVVMGTNFDHKVISEQEFFGYITAMGENAVQILYEDYLLIYDKRKKLIISGDSYLVGSYLMSVPSGGGNMFEYLTDEDIEGFKENIASRVTELILNGERHDALELD